MISKITILFVVLLVVACAMEEPAAPLVRFGVQNVGCQAPCQIAFKDSSENKGVYNWNYDWSFKDSTSFSSDQNPVHSFSKAGKYQVVLTISNEKYGSSSAEKTITINAPVVPVANFEFTGEDCNAPCAVSFKNLSQNAKSYKWEFGDSSAVSLEESPKHTFTKSGTFKVILTATNGAVSDTASAIVNVQAVPNPPVADFDIVVKDSTRADSVVYSFVNKSKNATAYLWNFGDKVQSAITSPTHAYARMAKDATYNVLLTAISGSQKHEKTRTITVRKK